MLRSVAPSTVPEPSVTTAGHHISQSLANSLRLAAAADSLASIMQNDHRNNPNEFCGLCLSLARGIDFAVANNECPDKALDLPLLVKQICRHRNDLVLQAAIMVLLISVRSACKIGWFPQQESEELFSLFNEVGSSFSSSGGIHTELNSSLSAITTIMKRFYPRIKLGKILSSLEVKPGYGTFMIDFHISKNVSHSPLEKIRLFVAQTDHIETSACIISPPQVSFLVNGKGVDKRTNIFMDTGPQIPTNITAVLKYGSNLLQAVGEFSGHYIIIVAFMSVVSPPDTPALQDYVQPDVAAVDSDSDIIEGPSRISLNCPISYTRIKVPVKGHCCKHLQCFDFDNFIDINSRRPSWRCPHCNRSVCYPDIRVDQNMVKVLKEVGETVSEVIISADGSWKAVFENDDNLEQAQDKTLNCSKQNSDLLESTGISDPHNVLDLTKDDDKMDSVYISETEDRKPCDTNVVGGVNQIPPLLGNDFWSRIYSSANSLTTSDRLDAHISSGLSDSNSSNYLQPPIFNNSISPIYSQVAEALGLSNDTTPAMHDQFSGHSNQVMNPSGSNDYATAPPLMPRNITRIPIGVQALPAQPQPQILRTSLNSSTPNIPVCFTSSVAHSIASAQEVLPRSQVDLSTSTQNWNRQDCFVSVGQLIHQVSVPLPTTQVFNRSTSMLRNDLRNPLQQYHNPRGIHYVGQSSDMTRQSSPLQRTQAPLSGRSTSGSPLTSSTINRQHPRYPSPSQRATPTMVRQTPMPPQNQTIRSGPSFGDSLGTKRPRIDGLTDLPSEQNWRPTGRMRGSLQGQAYADALNQFMNSQQQPTQAAPSQPPSNLGSTLVSVSPQLQALTANNRNANAPQTRNIQ